MLDACLAGMKPLSLAALLVVAGCTDRARFEPTHPTAQGHGGQPAASYDIRVAPHREAHAVVNVWSKGAAVEDGRTIARLAVELRNTGDRMLQLEPNELRLDAYTSDEKLPAPQLVQIVAQPRSLAVPPGEAATVQLAFAMPVAVDPDRITSLRLRWSVDHHDGRRYVQFTDFQRVEEYPTTTGVYYDPVFGLYDPFLYGPPYVNQYRFGVPVRRMIVQDRDRDRAVRQVRRDREQRRR